MITFKKEAEILVYGNTHAGDCDNPKTPSRSVHHQCAFVFVVIVSCVITAAVCGLLVINRRVSYSRWRQAGRKRTPKGIVASQVCSSRGCSLEVADGTPLPPEIANATFSGLWKHFECTNYFEEVDRPINHKLTWTKMRSVYVELIKPEPSIVSRLMHEDTAIQVPYEVRQLEGKGLGLFAKANVPKGTVIDDVNRGGRVKFNHGNDFRRFINSVPAPDMACLVLQCAAVESTTNKTNPRSGAFIAVDLDDNCLMNHGYGDEQNAGILEQSDYPTCDYATRDIESGEEISCAYGEYAYGDGWKWFSL